MQINEWALSIGVVVLNAVWLLTNAVGLPGNWLMVATTVIVTWAAARPPFSTTLLVVIFVLALAGEALEFAASAVGTRRAGGTRAGTVGALVGTLVGGILGTFFIPLPVIGSIAGACVGAALGALGFELSAGGGLHLALRSGAGAGVGRLGGTLIKLGVGVTIWLIVSIAAFWP